MHFSYVIFGLISVVELASALPAGDAAEAMTGGYHLVWSGPIDDESTGLSKRDTAGANANCYTYTYYRNDGTSQTQYVDVICR
ncbi:uncharacterized protein GIQ15_04055 [Arthroderma uncinatum]|uniref:uncharacterized protein n=1 Tax=Arthroderma uncinatum TaxID=74035 RepID=UPI00144A4D9D|nr:uncharacterized protein GIQ15_04055 [Arthroderma uncinatum]KAF3481296.1 hypothetical protein GIQ15_04055 [Arthroderma uncinatum]